MGGGPEWTFPHGGQADGWQVHGGMLGIAGHWRGVYQDHGGLLPHTGQSGHHQKNLETINARGVVWGRGNPPALLVGMWIDTATVENSVEVP